MNVTPATTIAPRPTQATTGATARSRELDRLATVATRPPTASSHIRVGVMKYALAGDATVCQTETASETTTTPPMTVRATVVDRRRERSAMKNARSMSNGHSR